MSEIAIPLPALRFPEPGWRERFERYVESGEESGLALEARLEAPATESALRAAPQVQGALRALLAGANGGRVGHVHLLSANAIGPGAPVVFASDYVGSWSFSPGEAHEVALACRDGTDEHRFTTLGAFLEAMLARAWAQALHRRAEVAAGDDLDDRPWVLAARAIELRIDAKMLRTRED